MSVVRISGHRAHADHQAFLRRHRHRHFHAELVRRARLALGEALDLRSVQRVQLVRVVAALAVKSFGQCQFVSQRLRHRFRCLALEVADHSAQPASQLSQLTSHPTVLLRVRVTPRLLLGARADSRVALTQHDAVGLGFINELFTGSVQQSTVGRRG